MLAACAGGLRGDSREPRTCPLAPHVKAPSSAWGLDRPCGPSHRALSEPRASVRLRSSSRTPSSPRASRTSTRLVRSPGAARSPAPALDVAERRRESAAVCFSARSRGLPASVQCCGVSSRGHGHGPRAGGARAPSSGAPAWEHGSPADMQLTGGAARQASRWAGRTASRRRRARSRARRRRR